MTVDAVKAIVGPPPIEVPTMTAPAVDLASYNVLIPEVGT